MRSHSRRLGNGIENRPLDLLGDGVRLAEAQRPRQLQVERDLRPSVHRQHVHVVHLAHVAARAAQLPGQLSNLGLLRRLRLDVDDDVGLRQRPPHGILDIVGGRVPLRHGRAGWDADHDIDEVTPSSLSQPEPAQLRPPEHARESPVAQSPPRRPERGP